MRAGQLCRADRPQRQRQILAATLHDLNLAALYCDQLYVLKGGAVVASGPPEQVLTPALIQSVYGVRAEVATHPATGRLHVVFLPLRMTVEVQRAQRI